MVGRGGSLESLMTACPQLSGAELALVPTHKRLLVSRKLWRDKKYLDVDRQRYNPNILLQRLKRKNYPNPGGKVGEGRREGVAKIQQSSSGSDRVEDPCITVTLRPSIHSAPWRSL